LDYLLLSQLKHLEHRPFSCVFGNFGNLKKV
jgi:hypothetical protein